MLGREKYTDPYTFELALKGGQSSMPFMDAYIPEGALSPSAERELIVKLSDLLIEHEGVDPANETVRRMTWVSVHRPKVYVGGGPTRSPRYRFICQVPEGQYNDERRAAISAGITNAVAEAEEGAFPLPEARVSVFPLEIPDGTWGAIGGIIRLPDIYEMAWPPTPDTEGEPREAAALVLAERRRGEAEGVIAAACESPPPLNACMRVKADKIGPSVGTDPVHVSAGGETHDRVCAVALPPDAQALTTLDHVDYTDAFRLEIGLTDDRTPEAWARALLEEAPAATRTTLRRGWSALGVQLGSAEDERLVLGWPMRRNSPEYVLLAARSLLGMEAEVLVKREHSTLLVATFMHLRNPVARAVWTAFAPRHRRVLHHLVKAAGRRARGDAADSHGR
jgi:phenylpyruvate tautomerase PptA (4-oxalocrotonate tautomerase family)